MRTFKEWRLLRENTDGVEQAYFNVNIDPNTPEAQIRQDPELTRNLALELTFAYNDYQDSVNRQAIVQHMKKLPMKMVGDPGQIVSFDGRHMETDDDVVPGDAVKVVSPGFTFTGPIGDYYIGKAVVLSAPGVSAAGPMKITPLGR
jgi:hypothetical protein